MPRLISMNRLPSVLLSDEMGCTHRVENYSNINSMFFIKRKSLSGWVAKAVNSFLR
jgi:hypothetical protein